MGSVAPSYLTGSPSVVGSIRLEVLLICQCLCNLREEVQLCSLSLNYLL